jgi:hypothetical protein
MGEQAHRLLLPPEQALTCQQELVAMLLALGALTLLAMQQLQQPQQPQQPQQLLETVV